MGTLVTGGRELPLGKRTTAIVEELYAMRDDIEGQHTGAVEIQINFAGKSLTVSAKKVSKRREIG